MSIRIMTEVWDSSEYAGTKLLCLLCLADFANDEGMCWPSVTTIAKKCRCSDRNIQMILRELEKSNDVSKQERKGTSNMYWISNKYIQGVKPTSGGGEAGFGGGVKPTSGVGVKPSSPKPLDRTINEPSSKRFVPPSPKEVAEYASSIMFALDSEHFCAYYQKQGWKLSNGLKMTDWKSAVVTWKKNEKNRGNNGARQSDVGADKELGRTDKARSGKEMLDWLNG